MAWAKGGFKGQDRTKGKVGTFSSAQKNTIKANASAMRGNGTKSTIKYNDRSAQGKANVYLGRTSTRRTRG